MNRRTGLSILALMLVLGGGCRSSREDANLTDLMRDLQAEEALSARAAAGEKPDTPVSAVSASISGAELPAVLDAGEGQFEPLDMGTVGSLTIQADSVLRITVTEDPGLSGSYPVNGLGGILFGYVGPVILDNLTESQAAEKIRQILLSREFQSATVAVKILRPSYDRVRIAGSVKRPGEIKLGAGDEVTLNNALNQAGGITDTPWRTQVKVVRGGLSSIMSAYLPGEVYELVDAEKRPYVPDVRLRNNDVVFVYSRLAGSRRGGKELPRWVLVLGEVRTPGFHRFEPAEGFTMMNLLFRLGGLPPYANDKAIRVIRQNSDGVEEEFKVNGREIMKEGNPELDFPLMSGDRIIVPARRLSLF